MPAALVFSGAIVEEKGDAIVAVAVAVAVTLTVMLLAVTRGIGLVGLANRRTDALQQRLDRDSLTRPSQPEPVRRPRGCRAGHRDRR
jgi:hypothetical protein